MSRLRLITIVLGIIVIVLGVMSISKLINDMDEISIYASETPLAVTREAQASSILETRAASEIVELTESAPTATPTITPTDFPTATITPTNIIPTCEIQVAEESLILYMGPSKGFSSITIEVSRESVVEINGRLNDFAWYSIKHNNEVGWIRTDEIMADADCINSLKVIQLSEALQNSEPQFNILLEDTFFEDAGFWFDSDFERITSRTPSEFGDYRISLGAGVNEFNVAKLNDSTLQTLEDFELHLSISPRTLASDTGYFGIRFRVNSEDENFLEFRIFGECSIGLYMYQSSENDFIPLHDSPVRFSNSNNTCKDDLDDYLHIVVKDGTIRGELNNAVLPEISFGGENIAQQGAVEIIASESFVDLYFAQIAAP
ncbi:MAG: hypothetical protein DWQ07_25990 [Chloroflexi bacterium]|nr:MAG: hypothetical protein DWQ07_25990 [Chloroflexota bacterium]